MGKHGDPEEIKAHIEVATGLCEVGMTIEEIAEDLDISIDRARDYSRGYPSSSAYTKELERQAGLFRRLLRIKLKDLQPIGDCIREIKPGKSVVIKFLVTHLSVPTRERMVEEAVYSNLELLGLSEQLAEKIYLHYKDGKYSLRAKDLAARAYINAYAEIVLAREVVESG